MTAQTFAYETTAPKVISALRKAFGENTVIATNEGYLGRVHVKVVSPWFDGKTERQKQEFLWDVLKTELGEEAQAVSLAVGYGIEEL